MKKLIVAIDGPSGSGKGVLAQKLSEIFHLAYLDTGLLYRAVAYKLLQNRSSLGKITEALKIAQNLKPEDLCIPALRADKVASFASKIASSMDVRTALLKFQTDFIKNALITDQGVILDGRDIGTKVLPEARFKIFLTANLEVRAQRRHKELQDRGIKSIYSDVLEDMRERDRRDCERDESPLIPAQDAYVIDTSAMQINEVVDHVVRYISKRSGATG
ncbi:MAG: (d)CMP kinase [Alphaproteobacteria bacterium]|nr:(d)CMP kinase [Alphaproteobacteria bacterium]